jgi:hypothetical protein
MNVVLRRLNETIENRPAWQEALIVGISVAVVLVGVFFAEGKHPGTAIGLAVSCGCGGAIGARLGRPVRARRRARRFGSS